MSAKPSKASKAINRYLKYLQLTLSCVSKAVWLVAPSPVGDEKTLIATTSADPIPLKGRKGAELFLAVVQEFHVTTKAGDPSVSTDRYSYTLSLSEDLSKEFLLWHWHPATNKIEHPHLHICIDHETLGATRKLHTPSGRVSFEQIVKFLIADLGVKQQRADWEDVIRDVERRFKGARSWS